MLNQHGIRELYQNLTESLRNKDIASTIENFADQSVMFVLPPPLQLKTGENAPGANGIEEWFASFEGKIGLEFVELEVVSDEHVAFLHCLVHLTGKRTDGSNTDMWYRETLGLRKIQGTWKISHQHQSVPMYMDGSGKAATDLKP